MFENNFNPRYPENYILKRCLRTNLNIINLNSDCISSHLSSLHDDTDSIVEYGDESSPDVSTAQTVDVEVEGKVQQFQIVGHCSKYLQEKFK